MNHLPNEWQLQTAKNRLSQLVKEAGKGVPQFITVHGERKVVVISTQDYQEMKRPQSRLSSVLLRPILGEDDDLFTRDLDAGRDVDL
jgi:prevent-host-death family protein